MVKRYGRVTALDHSDFDLYPGEVLAVIGDNGAGKSSLIKALTGAAPPDIGDVYLAGQLVNFKNPMEGRLAGIETVYQNLAVSPSLNIADNLFLGRELLKPGFLGKWLRMLDHKKMEADCPRQTVRTGFTDHSVDQSSRGNLVRWATSSGCGGSRRCIWQQGRHYG